MTSVAWVSESLQNTLASCLATPPRAVHSVAEFVAYTRGPEDVAFVDGTTIGEFALLTHVPISGPVIAICDEPLPSAIGWLARFPISQVASTTMLKHAYGPAYLANVLKTLGREQPRLLDWVRTGIAGRRVRLTHASRRGARLEKMAEQLTKAGVSTRTTQALRDAAEELLTNAFYDAPVAAGALKKPVPRTEDIALPDDCACDLAYGSSDDLAFVRLRDPFGSLTRRRLIEVLGRCARSDMSVEVDETMGGAGLGMWRVFSNASFVAISVVKGQHTEVLVGIAKKAAGAARPYAFNFFFKESGKKRFWRTVKERTNTPSGVNRSVMIVSKST